MSEGKLISVRKYTRRWERRTKGTDRPNHGDKLGLTVILPLSLRTSNISGITVPLFSLMALSLIFSNSESPRPRPPVSKRSRHCLLSSLSCWSWLFFPHSGTVIHDKKPPGTSLSVGAGSVMSIFLGAFPAFLQASCFPCWCSCKPHQLLKQAVNPKTLSVSLRQRQTP